MHSKRRHRAAGLAPAASSRAIARPRQIKQGQPDCPPNTSCGWGGVGREPPENLNGLTLVRLQHHQLDCKIIPENPAMASNWYTTSDTSVRMWLKAAGQQEGWGQVHCQVPCTHMHKHLHACRKQRA